MIDLKGRLPKYSPKQFSGKRNVRLKRVSNCNFYIKDIVLPGDQPKEYIHVHFYSKKCSTRKGKPSLWPGYYAKFGYKSYPTESITEFLINKIGEGIGFNMNETELALINGQVRFLSRDFLNHRNQEKLIHGIEVIAEYLEDRELVDEINANRLERRQLLTYELVSTAISEVYHRYSDELLLGFNKMILFDAIVGNNDRHYENWGVIGNAQKANNSVVFSPLYDQARGLLWNLKDSAVKNKFYNISVLKDSAIEAYCQRPTPRLGIEGIGVDQSYNHFVLIRHLIQNGYLDREMVLSHVNDSALEKAIDIVGSFQNIDYYKSNVIKAILNYRFNKINELLR